MGLFSRKDKSLVAQPQRTKSSEYVLPEKEKRAQPPEIQQKIDLYIQGNWDKVKLVEGDYFDLRISSPYDFLSVQSALTLNSLIQEPLTKTKSRVLITDLQNVEESNGAIAKAINWGIPLMDIKTLAETNPKIYPDIERRNSFKEWLGSKDERTENWDYFEKLRSLRSGGEKIPGLLYCLEYSRQMDKLVFVEKRKEATDLLMSDLNVKIGDGFVIACEISQENKASKILSVKYKKLEIGQIAQKQFEHYEFMFREFNYGQIVIVGALDNNRKVQAFVAKSRNN